MTVGSGCYVSSEPSAGVASAAGFLQACGEGCAPELSCVRQVCTRPCDDDRSCASLAVGARCLEAPDPESQSGTAACELLCESGSDCADLGEAFACVRGLCRVAPADIAVEPHDVDAGAPQVDGGAGDDAGVDSGQREDAGPGPVLDLWSPGGQVEAGASHTCAVIADGSLWCWGGDFYGQLGDGDVQPQTCSTEATKPCAPHAVQVGQHNAWVAVSAGHTHTCALRSDKTLWCWGANSEGAVGDDSTDPRTAPVPVGTDADWAAVSAGEDHTCALKTDGSLWCWGRTSDGEIGVHSPLQDCVHSKCVPHPVRLGTDTDWASLSAGGQITCAIKASGALWCWGWSFFNQLGQQIPCNDDGCASDPVQVGTATDWASVSVWASHTCAIKVDGSLWCSNQYLCDDALSDAPGDDSGMLFQVGTETDWQQVALGEHYTCGLRDGGSLWCRGASWFGTLGDGVTEHDFPGPDDCSSSFVQVGAGSAWEGVTASLFHACGIRDGGQIWCWGDNSAGQLGDGRLDHDDCEGSDCSRAPVPVTNAP